MKTMNILFLSTFCLSQAHAFNFPSKTTRAYDCEVCSTLSHESLQDSWVLKNNLLNTKTSNMQRSYGYKESISSYQLHKGVKLSTLAPGAVIRITPMQNKPMPALEIQTPNNQTLTIQEASSLYSDSQALMDTVDAKNPPTMFQLKPELGQGTFIIKSYDAANKDKYMLSVLDKYSMTYLQVETNAIHYEYGDTLTATVTLKNESNHGLDDLVAYLESPDGEKIDLDLKEVSPNKFQTSVELNSLKNTHGANWYLEAGIVSLDENIIKRSGHSAFSYSVPSASLLSLKKVVAKSLSFEATIDVATSSRYALQTVLFQKDAAGKINPIATTQRAQWLEKGKQTMQFSFDNSQNLAEDNLYLGYFHLIDYGQLKPVYVYNQRININQLG